MNRQTAQSVPVGAVNQLTTAGTVLATRYGRLLSQLSEMDRVVHAQDCASELRNLPADAWKDFFPAEVWGNAGYCDPFSGLMHLAVNRFPRVPQPQRAPWTQPSAFSFRAPTGSYGTAPQYPSMFPGGTSTYQAPSTTASTGLFGRSCVFGVPATTSGFGPCYPSSPRGGFGNIGNPGGSDPSPTPPPTTTTSSGS